MKVVVRFEIKLVRWKGVQPNRHPLDDISKSLCSLMQMSVSNEQKIGEYGKAFPDNMEKREKAEDVQW